MGRAAWRTSGRAFYLPVMAVLHSIANLVVQLLCQCLQGWQPLQAQLALRHRRLHELRGICEHCQ